MLECVCDKRSYKGGRPCTMAMIHELGDKRDDESYERRDSQYSTFTPPMTNVTCGQFFATKDATTESLTYPALSLGRVFF
jgi:hypothetical protein